MVSASPVFEPFDLERGAVGRVLRDVANGVIYIQIGLLEPRFKVMQAKQAKAVMQGSLAGGGKGIDVSSAGGGETSRIASAMAEAR